VIEHYAALVGGIALLYIAVVIMMQSARLYDRLGDLFTNALAPTMMVMAALIMFLLFLQTTVQP
jgi:hypothetical protein